MLLFDLIAVILDSSRAAALVAEVLHRYTKCQLISGATQQRAQTLLRSTYTISAGLYCIKPFDEGFAGLVNSVNEGRS